MNTDDKKLYFNIGSAFVIKGIALLISFLSLPAYIKYFNNEIGLGLWFTILSILNWVLTFDFGIGNGLRNKIIKPLKDKDYKSVKEYISSTYIIIGILTLILTLVLFTISYFVDWNFFFNIDSLLIPTNTIFLIVAINLLTILLQFFLRTINSILYALHKSSINDFLALITSLIQYLFLILYWANITDIETNLFILSFVHMISVILPLVLITIIVFTKDLKYAKPRVSSFSKSIAKDVLFNGGAIFINQILYMVLTTTNPFLISFFIDPQQVVEYQIYYRIFILTGTLYMLALTPLWSAVAKANYEKNFKWINKYFNLMSLGAILILVVQVVIVLLLQWIFNIWLGTNAPTVDYNSAILFSIFGGIFAMQSTLSTFSMGFNKLKLQAIVYSLAVIIKIILVVILTNFVSSWSIVVLIDIIAFTPYVIIEFVSLKRLMYRLNEKSGIDGEIPT